MKKVFLLSAFIVFTTAIFAQTEGASPQGEPTGQAYISKKVALNVGVLMGGGSLAGADIEVMPAPKFGLQAGMGISSFGFGVNYHLKNRINSSFISVQYWNQGFGNSHYASYVGPMFVFRAKKIFQAGLGFAAILDKGPQYNLDKDINAALLYNIGVYFPL